MTNNLKDEIDKILDNPLEAECGACSGTGSYRISVSTSSTESSEMGYVQECLVCKGLGRTGYSPELTKQKLLALINQKEKELKDELFSREQILEILSYLPPLHYTPNALKAVLQEHWNGVLPFYDDEKVKELGGKHG